MDGDRARRGGTRGGRGAGGGRGPGTHRPSTCRSSGSSAPCSPRARASRSTRRTSPPTRPAASRPTASSTSSRSTSGSCRTPTRSRRATSTPTTRTRTSARCPAASASVTTPRAGVHDLPRRRFGMAHIYGDNRADLMFGAGYATAEERLFLMDAIRRTAKGTLAGLLGRERRRGRRASSSPTRTSPTQELTAQFNELDERFGAAGRADAGRHPRLHRRDQRPDRRGEDEPERDAGRVRGARRDAAEAGRSPTRRRWRCCSSPSSPSRTAARR